MIEPINETMKNRPSYVETYLRMAMTFSELAHDKQTAHGTILTDPDYKIISAGFNGNPRGCRDDLLPDERPTTSDEEKDPWKNKYLWKIHSEQNAIYNCSIRPPKGSKAFVTGQVCCSCAFALWQFRIDEIFMLNRSGTKLFDNTQQEVFDIFVSQTGIKIHYVDLDI